MLICLENAIPKKLIIAMAKKSPARVICLDRGFDGADHLKTNAKEIFHSFKIIDFKTV